MTGYKHKVVDLDTIFEPLRSGDPKYPYSTGTIDALSIDARDKYVALSAGSETSENVGYKHINTDFKKIFAAIGSVPRFKTPLPWDRTVVPAVAKSVYRQPSRNLTTTMDMTCHIREDGKVEIKVISPNIHSHPTSKTTDTVYSLTGTPAWVDGDTPANTNYQVRFDVVSGSGYTLDNGLSFGTWVDMPNGHPGGLLRGSLRYNHSNTAEGTKTANGSIRISVRRKDFPNTNKADAVMTVNLSLRVLASLFTDPDGWSKTISVANTGSNPHDPDGLTATYTSKCKVEFNADGTIAYSTQVQNSAWVSKATSSWRRAESSVASSDYEVLCEVTSTVGGSLSNPISSWKQMTQNYVVTFTQSIGNNSPAKDYAASVGLRFTVRQKSTKGWSGVADNFVVGQCTLNASVRIGAPIAPDWSGMTLANLSRTLEVEQIPSSPSTWITTGVRWLIDPGGTTTSNNAFGQGIVGNDGGWGDTLSSKRVVPSGWDPGEFEFRFRKLGGSVSIPSEGTWYDLDRNGMAAQCTLSKNHGSGPGTYTASLNLAIDIRRKSYHAHAHTFTSNMTATIELTAPRYTLTPPEDYTRWAGTYSDTYSTPF